MEKTHLTQEEVLRNNFFIQNVLIEGRLVGVYAEKEGNDYRFFLNTQKGLEPITGKKREILLNKLTPKDDGNFWFVPSENDYSVARDKEKSNSFWCKYGKVSFKMVYDDEGNFDKETKKEFVEQIKNAISINIEIMENLKISPQIIKKTLENLNDVVIALTPTNISENCEGVYQIEQHGIVLTTDLKNNKFEIPTTVACHELFHAMTSDKNMCGLTHTKKIKRNCKQDEGVNRSYFRGFNELITVLLAEKIQGEEFVGYGQAFPQLLVLFQNDFPKWLFEAYLTNNQDLFLINFIKEFGISGQCLKRYLKGLNLFTLEANKPKTLYNIDVLEDVTLCDSVLFSICRIWNKNKNIEIKDFKLIAKEAKLDVDETIAIFFKGLTYADPSLFEVNNINALARNVLAKLNKKERKCVIDQIIALKLEDEFLKDKPSNFINKEFLQMLSNELYINVGLSSVKKLISENPEGLKQFIETVLVRLYHNKGEEIITLALLTDGIAEPLAKACLIKAFKKDLEYTGVEEAFFVLSSSERDLILNQLANTVYNKYKTSYSKRNFIDVTALKMLIKKNQEKTITNPEVAKNVFISFSTGDFVLESLTWKEVSALFASHSKNNEDKLIKEYFFLNTGRKCNFERNFNEFLPEEKETMWNKAVNAAKELKKEIVLNNTFQNMKTKNTVYEL